MLATAERGQGEGKGHPGGKDLVLIQFYWKVGVKRWNREFPPHPLLKRIKNGDSALAERGQSPATVAGSTSGFRGDAGSFGQRRVRWILLSAAVGMNVHLEAQCGSLGEVPRPTRLFLEESRACSLHRPLPRVGCREHQAWPGTVGHSRRLTTRSEWTSLALSRSGFSRTVALTLDSQALATS